MSNQKNSKSAIRLPLFIAAAIAVGIFIGANMAGGSNSGTDSLYQSIFKFRQVMSYIQNDYVDNVDTDQLVETAIEEMLTKLDPHSVYIPAEELQMTQSQLEGNFEGIGVEFNIFKDTINVVSPLSGGPSEALGIMPGDKIITVDGKSFAGQNITNQDVVKALRGEKGSEVVVEIKRRGVKDLIEYTIVRDVIPQYSVDVSYMVDDEIGYIKVSRFAATTYIEFKEALAKLSKAGMKKLVLDLTGNPGGYMDPAVKIVDEILADNQMIVYTKGKDSRHNSEYYSRQKGDFEKGTVIVLIDEGSASASEIVSGALQDHDRALVVGRRSFGKGLVQMPVSLKDGSAMRLTISRYYTPSGRCIQKPYDGSLEDYHMEFYKRFESGEVYSADSIHFNDSLVFKTDKGREVYGGGGIMPDYFVALDTSENSTYLTRLFNSNSVAEFSLKYVDQNRKKLEKMSLDQFIAQFEVTDKILEGLKDVGEQNKVKYSQSEFDKSKQLIQTYLKAFIARNIWKNDGFYPIFNQQNEVFQKALTLIDEASNLASN
ncbi:MAG: S41 family peptidase [Marinoscillum sp.]